MTVRKLSDIAGPTLSVQPTVCVVGAGVAGLMAAVRLARDRLVRVVVIESGVEKNDTTMSDLDGIDNPAGNYDGNLRARGLGGTSSRWDGKLLPISRSDMAGRPWVDQQPWPFDVAELDRYTRQLETMLGVDSSPYEKSISFLLDPDGLLPRKDPDFLQRWPKRPRPSDLNIADVLREELAAHPNIDIWLGATASRFAFDPVSDRLDAIVATDHYGRSLTVNADEFIIAAGALESTRLMLIADRQSGGVVTRSSDALGRYFNDHLGLNVATVRPLDQLQTSRALADRWTLGGNRHLHFELRPEVQEQGRVASAYFDFGAMESETSALTQIRVAAEAAKSRRPAAMLLSTPHVLTGLPDLVKTTAWRYGRKKRYWSSDTTIELKIWIEQLPRWSNRIVLSDATDSLGQPRLRCELDKTDDEERTLRFTVNKIREFWARHLSDVATLEWIAEVDEPGIRLVDHTVELAHPAGSTRMGTDPATSVVDTSLRVHAVPNLSIASSSVFPTSGSANPTLTVIQLAMRAADAVADRLQSRSTVYRTTSSD
jgi:choline dehydrogenase-like flavoprotein